MSGQIVSRSFSPGVLNSGKQLCYKLQSGQDPKIGDCPMSCEAGRAELVLGQRLPAGDPERAGHFSCAILQQANHEWHYNRRESQHNDHGPEEQIPDAIAGQ